MAWNDDKDIWYWNDSTATTSATSAYASTSNAYTAATSCTAGTINYTIWIEKPRRIWVEMPEAWSQEWLDDWVRLVNIETKTGCKVLAMVKGKVCVVDPNDEIRSFEDFVPLFRSVCGKEDAEKFAAFLASHPITKGPGEQGAAVPAPV